MLRLRIASLGAAIERKGMRRGYTYGERLERALGHFDGCLCLPESEGLYRASLTRFGGLGYSALAFWDRTVDKRPGSNSIFFAPSLKCSPETIMRGAEKFFPTVYARLPAIDLSQAIAQTEAMRVATPTQPPEGQPDAHPHREQGQDAGGDDGR